MGAEVFFDKTQDGVRIQLRATPGAAATEISGIWNDGKGEARLAVKVTAPPDKGKANAAIIKLPGRFRDKVVPGLSFPTAKAVKILASAPSRAGREGGQEFG